MRYDRTRRPETKSGQAGRHVGPVGTSVIALDDDEDDDDDNDHH